MKKDLKLTRQERIDFIDPIFGVVGVVFLIPNECAFDVRLWWHWAETQSGIITDDAFLELVLGATFRDCRRKNQPVSDEENRQDGVENQIEKENFCCKKQT